MTEQQIPLDLTTCQLYRHFDKEGVLLYVGISLHAVYRLSQHRNGACWFSEIARVEVENFESRAAAEIAEIRAIKEEKPKYNGKHNNSRQTLDRKSYIKRVQNRKKYNKRTKSEITKNWRKKNKKRFDEYHREYMRDYMRKRRAKLKTA